MMAETLLPVITMPGLCAVVVFGGSFDPPQIGHVHAALAARRWLAAAIGRSEAAVGLVFVPAARSPFKDAAPAASDQQRIDMLKLVVADIAGATVWTEEIDRSTAVPCGQKRSPSYTIDTITRARAQLDRAGRVSVPMRLLIGTDQAREFHRWKDAEDLLTLAPPIIVSRERESTPRALAHELRTSHHWSDRQADVLAASVVPVEALEASSTAVRAALGAGEAEGERHVSPAVYDYIKRHGLYGVRRPHAADQR